MVYHMIQVPYQNAVELDELRHKELEVLCFWQAIFLLLPVGMPYGKARSQVGGSKVGVCVWDGLSKQSSEGF